MASTIYLADSENNLLYTFPAGFHLEKYRMARRSSSVEKAFQHGGDVIGDKKYELQHISLTGLVAGDCLSAFEAACSNMKRAIHRDNLRLYGAYKESQFFEIKILEDAEWDFLTDGGIADAVVNFLADPFRYDRELTTIGPIALTGAALCQTGLTVGAGFCQTGLTVGAGFCQIGLTVSVLNEGDIEASPVITYAVAGACPGICYSNLKITNLTDDAKYFSYPGDLGCCVELVIDCENATVLLNGADAIGNVGPGSSFYSLVGQAGNCIVVQVDGEVGLTNTIKHEFRQRYF